MLGAIWLGNNSDSATSVCLDFRYLVTTPPDDHSYHSVGHWELFGGQAGDTLLFQIIIYCIFKMTT